MNLRNIGSILLTVILLTGSTPSNSSESVNLFGTQTIQPLLLSTSVQLLESQTGGYFASTLASSVSVKQSKTIQGTAFWQSFLIPGLGQIATGRPRVGYAFLAAEAGLISGLVGLRIYAGRLEDDYRLFAGQHAGVSTEKEHQYYVDLGNWMDVRSFNEARLRDRSFDAMYTDPGDAWLWDSNENRARFKTMRLNSDEARGKALLLVGGLVLNHLFAAVEAAGGAAKKYEMGYSPLQEGGGKFMVSYSLP